MGSREGPEKKNQGDYTGGGCIWSFGVICCGEVGDMLEILVVERLQFMTIKTKVWAE